MYRKMSETRLLQERDYVLHQLGLTMQRFQRVAALLCIGQKQSVSGRKLMQDMQEHYAQLEAIADELQYRRIP